jgi:hypothetical protein
MSRVTAFSAFHNAVRKPVDGLFRPMVLPCDALLGQKTRASCNSALAVSVSVMTARLSGFSLLGMDFNLVEVNYSSN